MLLIVFGLIFVLAGFVKSSEVESLPLETESAPISHPLTSSELEHERQNAKGSKHKLRYYAPRNSDKNRKGRSPFYYWDCYDC
uniref:Candidate secreted effector n=1 Tax=Meloidogyne incognita TaxID=6306 RepID=A0A914N739_MELIC